MVPFILFWIFAVVCIIGALFVVTSRNPVRAVLSLVATFISAACIWMILNVEFLALALVVIYVGAVMVLFMFVVMMLNIESATRKASFVGYWPLALAISLILLGLLTAMFTPQHFGLTQFPAPPLAPPDFSNIKQLGMALYTHYVYPFELAAVILLAAMIAAITLTHRGRQGSPKTQDISKQINVKASDRLKIVDMPSEPKGEQS